MAPAVSGKSRSTVCVPCSLFSKIIFIRVVLSCLRKNPDTRWRVLCSDPRVRLLGQRGTGHVCFLTCLYNFCGDSSATSVELWPLGLFL